MMQPEFWAEQDRDGWLRNAMTAKNKAEYWEEWRRRYSRPSDIYQQLEFQPDPSAIARYPSLSFMLVVPFKLQKPYISRDENDFSLLDNPVRREKVFQMPMVGAASWKGALRASLWQLGYEENNESIIRLFGNPRDEDVQQAGGRLSFFPAFFESIGLEVINPHSRATGAGGKGPILMECVPGGNVGLFFLLYVPRFQSRPDDKEILTQEAADLKLVAEGVHAMFKVYGFGAKTSSGFGLADIQKEGMLLINYPDAAVRVPQPAAPVEPESVRRFISEYDEEDFKLKPKAWRARYDASKREQDKFKEVKAEWLAYQEQLEKYRNESDQWEEDRKKPAPITIERTFGSFEILKVVIDELSKRWMARE